MLLAALATGVTGYMSLKEVGGESPEEIHEVCANVWLGLVIVHIAGVVIGSSIHRENLVRAMITGYKQGVPGVFRASPAARNASSACSTRYSGWSRPAPLRVRSIVRMRYLPPARLFPDPAWRAHIPSPAGERLRIDTRQIAAPLTQEIDREIRDNSDCGLHNFLAGCLLLLFPILLSRSGDHLGPTQSL